MKSLVNELTELFDALATEQRASVRNAIEEKAHYLKQRLAALVAEKPMDALNYMGMWPRDTK